MKKNIIFLLAVTFSGFLLTQQVTELAKIPFDGTDATGLPQRKRFHSDNSL